MRGDAAAAGSAKVRLELPRRRAGGPDGAPIVAPPSASSGHRLRRRLASTESGPYRQPLPRHMCPGLYQVGEDSAWEAVVSDGGRGVSLVSGKSRTFLHLC